MGHDWPNWSPTPSIRGSNSGWPSRSGDQQAIEKNIRRSRRSTDCSPAIAGARYLIWQAQHGDANTQQVHQTARGALLNELKSPPDWSLIPLALAQLEEQELAQSGPLTKGPEAREAGDPHHSLPPGHRPVIALAVVRRGAAPHRHRPERRGAPALRRIPYRPSSAASDLGRQVAQIAVERRDYQQAEAMRGRWPPGPATSRSMFRGIPLTAGGNP